MGLHGDDEWVQIVMKQCNVEVTGQWHAYATSRLHLCQMNTPDTIMDLPPACIVPCWQLAFMASWNLWHTWTLPTAGTVIEPSHTRVLLISRSQMKRYLLCRAVNRYTLVGLLLPYTTEVKKKIKKYWTDLIFSDIFRTECGWSWSRYCLSVTAHNSS